MTPSDSSLLEPMDQRLLPEEEGSHWRWMCCCDVSAEEMKTVTSQACEKVCEVQHKDVIRFEEDNVKTLMLPACHPPNPAPASEQSIASFPVSSMPRQEESVRRNTLVDTNVSFTFDSGLGPFLTSLKTKKSKVVRSSEFAICFVC